VLTPKSKFVLTPTVQPPIINSEYPFSMLCAVSSDCMKYRHTEREPRVVNHSQKQLCHFLPADSLAIGLQHQAGSKPNAKWPSSLVRFRSFATMLTYLWVTLSPATYRVRWPATLTGTSSRDGDPVSLQYCNYLDVWSKHWKNRQKFFCLCHNKLMHLTK
jgi:hypothetical protein